MFKAQTQAFGKSLTYLPSWDNSSMLLHFPKRELSADRDEVFQIKKKEKESINLKRTNYNEDITIWLIKEL